MKITVFSEIMVDSVPPVDTDAVLEYQHHYFLMPWEKYEN